MLISSREIEQLLFKTLKNSEQHLRSGTLDSNTAIAVLTNEFRLTVALSVVVPRLTGRYATSLSAVHRRLDTFDLPVWDRMKVDYERVVAEGFDAIPVDSLLLFALAPFSVDVAADLFAETVSQNGKVSHQWHQVQQIAVDNFL